MKTKPTQTQPTVLIQPLKAALLQGFDQHLDVLIRIQAPDLPDAGQKRRPEYHLALVIDRSGSMSGEPLQEARRCARHILDRMAPTDRAALVQFDNTVQVLVPNQPVGDGQVFRQALDQIEGGGMTDLHGGWEAGARALLPFARGAGMARVILLSDGNANEGETDPRRIAEQCRALAARGVTTSTYGLGPAFNEDLMVAMGEAGQGNHYYGQTARDLMDPFAEEFDLISQLYARHLRLSLATPEGITGTLLNDYPAEELRGGFPVVRLPDLAWGAEAWVVVRLTVPAALASATATPTPTPLIQVSLTGSGLDGEPLVFPEAQLKLPAIPPQSWEALVTDQLVQRRRDELEAARMLGQAREAAHRGDWSAVKRLLASAQEKYADNPWLQDVLVVMAQLAAREDQALFSKEALYSSRRMSTRLAMRSESMAPDDTEIPAFLRRKSAQGKAARGRKPKDPSDGRPS